MGIGSHQVVLGLAVRVVNLLALVQALNSFLGVPVELVADGVVRGPVGRLVAERHLAGLI